MASFQKHKSKIGITTWRVQIFVNGVRDSKGGFISKADAKIWASSREAEILSSANLPAEVTLAQNLFPPIVSITYKTLADVFDKYAREVSPTKSGAHWEKIDLPPLNSATSNLVKSFFEPENGHEEAFYRRANYWFLEAG